MPLNVKKNVHFCSKGNDLGLEKLEKTFLLQLLNVCLCRISKLFKYVQYKIPEVLKLTADNGTRLNKCLDGKNWNDTNFSSFQEPRKGWV